MDSTGIPAVYDTSIFLQAIISRHGPSAAALKRFEEGRVNLYISAELLDELSDVLRRASVRRKNSHYTDSDIENLLGKIQAGAIKLTDLPCHFSYKRDPKDEHILSLVVESGVDYLVTRDNDLLELMNEYDDEGRRFRSQFPNVNILGPVEFLGVLLPIASEE